MTNSLLKCVTLDAMFGGMPCKSLTQGCGYMMLEEGDDFVLIQANDHGRSQAYLKERFAFINPSDKWQIPRFVGPMPPL